MWWTTCLKTARRPKLTKPPRSALITGASAGLGAAFAQALAARGFDLVLTARRGERLQALAQEIEQSHGVRCQCIVADLADRGAPEAILDGVKSAGLKVDFLVNNAGYGLAGGFAAQDWAAHQRFLDVMVTAYIRLAHGVVDGMTARGYGRILNVASLAGLMPGAAGHTLYGGAKALLINFSQSLSAETRGRGVKVIALCPGLTYTEFHDRNGTRALLEALPRFMFQSAEEVAEAGLAALERDRTVYVPGLWNKILATVLRFAPRPWAEEAAIKAAAPYRPKS